MFYIDLQPIERQKFNITLDDQYYEITLVAVQNCMYATIKRENVELISGTRCVSGYALIPYQHLEGNSGNFAFKTQNEEMPWWEKFGSTQQLIYLSAAELAELRA